MPALRATIAGGRVEVPMLRVRLLAQAPGGGLMSGQESQQVSWWAVHEFVSAVLDQVNGWPMAGTPAWCSLAYDDPRKWAALFDAAQHHALRVNTAQEARCESSRSVAGAADWSGIASKVQRHGVYIPRRTAS